jgi:serine/threonine protein phosphatase PrpC
VVGYREKTRKPRDEEIQSYGLTHRGLVRAHNDDHFLIGQLRKRIHVKQSSLAELSQIPLGEERIASLIMVADGFGAGAKAEQASRIALEVATRYVAESARCYVRAVEEEMDLGHALEEAAKACHQAIQERAAAAQSATMASSLTLLVAVWPWAYLLHSGTSRYYQFRDGKLTQCSVDQDLTHPPTSSSTPAPIVTRTPSRWNTIHLLCTDGLTKHVSNERIAERLASIQSARQVCEDLLQDTLDNGGTDNVTIAIGRVIDRE